MIPAYDETYLPDAMANLAGAFDVKDVTMTDLISGRETLEDVNMIVYCDGHRTVGGERRVDDVHTVDSRGLQLGRASRAASGKYSWLRRKSPIGWYVKRRIPTG